MAQRVSDARRTVLWIDQTLHRHRHFETPRYRDLTSPIAAETDSQKLTALLHETTEIMLDESFIMPIAEATGLGTSPPPHFIPTGNARVMTRIRASHDRGSSPRHSAGDDDHGEIAKEAMRRAGV